ncbi:hypothetical protein [Moorena sp. SIO3H5]|uniref:hypothetical protein n=1 Tax=Moorena sp. SIO3H5 TaxID=2607834 RepID=UPI0025D1C3AB|nr:hypothetical protein [Moorena sp. SIO3H5]
MVVQNTSNNTSNNINSNQSRNHQWDNVRAALKRFWGYEDFRPPQGEIIRMILDS